MLKLIIQDLFKLKSISKKGAYLKKFGFTISRAQRLASKDNIVTISLDQLEKLCIAFNCTPNDLLSFTPAPDSRLPENHPLFSLIKKEVLDIPSLLASLPPDNLSELSKHIKTLIPPQ